MKKQSAIELFVNELINKGLLTLNGDTLKLIGVAKDVFNNQIIKAHVQGQQEDIKYIKSQKASAERYCNEKYN